jgi:hypothetical protein
MILYFNNEIKNPRLRKKFEKAKNSNYEKMLAEYFVKPYTYA